MGLVMQYNLLSVKLLKIQLNHLVEKQLVLQVNPFNAIPLSVNQSEN